jgi:hypothetical protein
LPDDTDFEASVEWREYEDALLGLDIGEGSIPPIIEKHRGYRQNVREWMARKELKTLEQAAARLRIDVSALKSIMSSRGRLRCGQETLNRVLETIGYEGA